MSQGVSEALLSMITIIIYMVLLGLAMSAIWAVIGDGTNPGMLDSILQIIAGSFVKVG